MRLADNVRFEVEVVEALESGERDPAFADVDDDALVEMARGAAADVAAATSRWLMILAELVTRGVWAEQGARTPTQWLSWAVSMGESTAREHIRVALRLRRFPKVAKLFAAGEISYSKVRAITRLDPKLEDQLLEYATYATGAQLERIVRGYRSVEDAAPGEQEDPWVRRQLIWRQEPDGTLDVRLRLPAVVGLTMIATLEHYADELHRETPPVPVNDPEQYVGENPDEEPSVDHHVSRLALMADALVAAVDRLAEEGPVDESGKDRHTLVIHVDAEHLDDPGAGRDRAVAVETNVTGGRRKPGMFTLRALRQIACQSGYVIVGDGDTPDKTGISGRTRRVPRRLRRLLIARDRQCRFPGCEARRGLDAHHIVHVVDGGQTELENLVLLCSFHHHWVHRYGWQIIHDGQGRFRFRPPDRPAALPPVLALPGASAEALSHDRADASHGLQSLWDGHPPDYDLCVAGLLREIRRQEEPHTLAA